MTGLLRALVRTPAGRGIRQGGNISPLLLNVYLDPHLDRPWRRRHQDVPLLRWADDLLILCRSREEAGRVYQDLAALLRPTGMQLKGSLPTTVHDLGAGDRAVWLGYTVFRAAAGLGMGCRRAHGPVW